MRFILIWAIRFYWFLIPETNRRKCIFKESCSTFVYKITKEKGFIAGMQSLVKRYKQCRPGYIPLELPDGERIVLLKDGSTISLNELNCT